MENKCAGMIRATTRHEGPVIPAKAGIHPIPPMDMPAPDRVRGRLCAGMTNQGRNDRVLEELQFHIL